MIATMQALLRRPRVRDDRGRRTLLAAPERTTDERPMPIVPGGFDEHAA